MNDEFVWRKTMRELSGPVQPRRELWTGIAERLTVPVSPRRWPLALAVVASLAIVFGTVLTFVSFTDRSLTSSTSVAVNLRAITIANAEFKALRNPDPRLVGAVIEVDSAVTELQQSLEQQPDAVFLVGLLNRNYARRMKLARMGLASI